MRGWAGRRRPRRATVTDSRWWYWIAAIPTTFGFWALAVAWVGVALALGPLAGSNPIGRAIDVSMVVFIGPALVLVAVFPFAVAADLGAVIASGGPWRPRRSRAVSLASIGPIVTLAGIVFDVLQNGRFDWLSQSVAVGFLVSVPIAMGYLYRRHHRLGHP